MSDALIDLFAEVLGVDGGALDDESSPDTIEQWDSLAAMHLVTAIEEKFELRLSTREMKKMTTIGLARATLKKKNVDL